MSTLHDTKKKVALLALLSAIITYHTPLLSDYPAPKAVSTAESECQLTKTKNEIIAILQDYGDDVANRGKINFEKLHSELHGIAFYGDATIPNGPHTSECRQSLEMLGINGISIIFEKIAAEFDALAQDQRLDTDTSEELTRIATDVRAIITIFKEHLTSGNPLGTLKLKNLGNRLNPYAYLMPYHLTRKGYSTKQQMDFWSAIINKLRLEKK